MMKKQIVIVGIIFVALIIMSISANAASELEGIWKGTEPNGSPGEWTYTFSDNNLDIIGPKEEWKGTFILDINKNPKHIDYTIDYSSLGDEYATFSYGIYEITGENLKICFPVPGHPYTASNFSDGRYYELTFEGKNNVIIPEDNNKDSNTGTPGFELVLLLISLSLFFIWKKRKKK